MAFQSPFNAHLDRGPFFPFPPLRGDFVQAGGAPRGGVCLLQPLVQQRLELTHVFEAELQGLEPANGGLGKHISIQRPQGESHVGLREAQLDPSLLELLGELLQVVRGRRVLVRVVVVPPLLLVLGRRVAVVTEVRAVVVLVVPQAVVVHPLSAPRDQTVHAEPRLGIDKALAVRRRHAWYVCGGGGGPPRPRVVVTVPVRLVHQVGRSRLVLLLLLLLLLEVVVAGVVHVVSPAPLHAGLDVLVAERARGPRGAFPVRQRRDPLVRVAERVTVALQRVVILQQGLRVPVRRGLLHAAGLRVHDGCAGGEDVVVIGRCGRHDSRSRTDRSY